MRLLEIKAPVALPIWFAEILSDEDIFSISYSKYGRVYKRGLEEQRDRMEMKEYTLNSQLSSLLPAGAVA